jgi:hypothetical protein
VPLPSGSLAFEMLGTAHPLTQNLIPEDLNLFSNTIMSMSSLALLSTAGWSAGSPETWYFYQTT